MSDELAIAIASDVEVVSARQRGRELAEEVGFSAGDQTVIAAAISQIAAAITVWSPALKPTSSASSRPRCRALTTSTSDAMAMASSSDMIAARLDLTVEEHESFLKVQRGRHTFQREAELHHGESDLRLNADDHRFGAAQPRHVREIA